MAYSDNDTTFENRGDLIASDRVEGTTVYNRQGERLGHISNFMVEKRSGQVRYAVLSFGGFLGLGQDHYPLPWSVLTYDTEKGGYVIDLAKEVLEAAPHYGVGERPFEDEAYGQSVYRYYGVTYPW
ncbi:PRC-barrel domain-containing protein [Sphingobium ummariense]|uniref:Photosystem reaction center subunit H n=1 Tax=Sphingobium ummariense RL-3 TaxID=1346791 RepID=T0K763_9SPHN|nr:PRC-barrel domain-containing protein [Sphingobium ummariense]EQB32499.1 photosystem reaction center subunit H [Sphingobium ummariense RL-3]